MWSLFPKDNIWIFIHFALYNISIYLVAMFCCHSKLTFCHGPLWDSLSPVPELFSFENKTYLTSFFIVLLDAIFMIVTEHVFFQALSISNAQPDGYGIFHEHLWNSAKASWKFLNSIIPSIVDMSVMMAQWIIVVVFFASDRSLLSSLSLCLWEIELLSTTGTGMEPLQEWNVPYLFAVLCY